MVASALMNDVPMKPKGFYSANSDLQHAAMVHALPLLQHAAVTILANQTKTHGLFTVVEYGAAQGNNSVEPLSLVLQHLAQSRTNQAHIILSDRPENDFNTLAHAITSVDWRASTGMNSVFASMIPQSFYKPIVPPNSANLAFSLACLHHLERVPPRPAAQSATSASRQKALRTQADSDLEAFLELRAAETQRGGALVLSFVGQGTSGETNYTGPVDACRVALVDMVKDGTLPAEAAAAFEVPTYNRSLDDVRRVLDRAGCAWGVRELFEKKVLHPAIRQLGAGASSAWYADTVVDWLMAVVSGYFSKAVQSALGDDVEEGRSEALLEDWTRRTKQSFLDAHKDEEVACWFIYASLERR